MREMIDSGVPWIEEIPKGWESIPLKSHFTFGKGLSITKENLVEAGSPVISYGQIHSKKNTGVSIDSSLFRFVKDSDTNRAAIVYPNDFLFADTSEDLSGCGNCVYNNTQVSFYGGYHTIILHSRLRSSNKYLAYLFKTDIWRNQIRSCLTEVKVYSVSQKILRRTAILIPPFEEQQRIADFLDSKCVEIDTILENTRASIEEYKKLKQSVITEAVTKGIRGSRQMKDSGVEWIGEIPKEWTCDKVVRLFETIGSGTTPKSSDDAAYVGSVNWIQSGDLNGGRLTTCKKHVNEDTLQEYSALKSYRAPFLVIAMYGASVGNMSISAIDGCVNQACCVLKGSRLDEQYAFFAIKSIKDYLIYHAVGGGQPNIGQDTIKSSWLPVPSEQEQQEIASYLDDKCAAIDSLIASKEALITELESYKKSLIYEYVTGKKEIE